MSYVALEEGDDALQKTAQAPKAVPRRREAYEKVLDFLCSCRFVGAAAGTAGVAALSSALYDALPPDERQLAREWAMLASIPIVALFFTWFHIWLAIQMMFRPVKFLGFEYGNTGMGLGWQGVVPRKCVKMAKTAFACARPYLLGPRNWMERVKPDVMMEKMQKELEDIVRASLTSVLRRHLPEVERRLPPEVREELTIVALENIEESTPDFWREITEILADKVDGIDNDGMIVTVFTQNKELLNHFFLTMGEREFRFIEYCGATFGFVCGCLQLVAFNHLDQNGRAVFLPLTGFVLGIFTNWLAIFMCFQPCIPRPIRLCGRHICDIQGLFLKRQPEVAETYSVMLCDFFFNFTNVIEYLQTVPPLWKRLKVMYKAHSHRVLRKTLGAIAVQLGPLTLGKENFLAFEDDLNNDLIQRVAIADKLHRKLEAYITVASDIARSNSEAMKSMPPDEFENLLHPVFKEDEWILILLGGILGAIVGIAQVYFLSE